MPRRRRVLFVCEGNIHRGPTAESLSTNTPGVARSAGLSSAARTQLTDELIEWADVVFVMERRLERMLRRRFPDAATEVVCLDIPDDYQLMQAELLDVLAERLRPHLGKAGRGPAR